MTDLREITFAETDLDALKDAEGRVAVFVNGAGQLGRGARRLNRLTKGALARAVADEGWEAKAAGDVVTLAYPVGMEAEAVDVVRLERRPTVAEARKAGATLARIAGGSPLTILGETLPRLPQLLLGLSLRGYAFTDHKSDKGKAPAPAHVFCSKPDETEAACKEALALAEGVFFTRDLVNEPANVLTTTEFADRLVALRDLGVEVEVIEEDRLAELGMNAMLCVGQGSSAPTKMVVMRWNGGSGDPLALVGKGVVFDSGGISLKPSVGMEDMTMDMGGAGVVSGVMKALAQRKAKANVVGLVGLVENMPSGEAVRPGDVVRSMKGDTIEVINTDAEGRLVLCDVLWYAQEHVKPAAMVDLATLTGACVVALGHENAAVFSNDDGFAEAFLKSAGSEDEGAWRMPMGKAYDDMLKSPIADMKNIGGRPAGSITAAQFLCRFVRDDMPWIHLDIAGVASRKTDGPFAPKGATGWGVLALDRLVRDRFETKEG
ncbi:MULTISPECIES: leucyl aminopeptidase [Salipiger]|uniref:Probable cytosol aminopeptidase n=1 Tax=Salipiger profundus TaxID=1229727 RepID=A0A1U7DAJ3_9RHOB|nr:MULTISPECIES: leucyl aminopeptidase [Salipiger]APX25096.1 leucyl aminopeptidase [Salipiger profundus]GGA15304.1 putative cytosol aminopeptidase [Salipiger profundus]